MALPPLPANWHLPPAPPYYVKMPVTMRSERLRVPGVPNFRKVAGGVYYASGQFDARGAADLVRAGVRTFVNFRLEDSDMRVFQKAGCWPLPDGVHYVEHRFKDETAPNPADALLFLRLVASPWAWPLLGHCHGGEGRAATMAALVRYTFDGWSMREAIDEQVAYRLGFSLAGVQLISGPTLVGLGLRPKLCGKQLDFLHWWAERHTCGCPPQPLSGW